MVSHPSNDSIGDPIYKISLAYISLVREFLYYDLHVGVDKGMELTVKWYVGSYGNKGG